MEPAIYTASVPVFLHYLARVDTLLDKIDAAPDGAAFLSARLAPDMFPVGVQLRTAAGFSLRIAMALAGRDVPDFSDVTPDLDGLRGFVGRSRAALDALSPEAFVDATDRRYAHRAGFADLDQDAWAFLCQYGLPNMMFHLSMAYAGLRQAGLDLGKADFDGLHVYPQGFSFER
ncbi:DUF1993 family protein [Qingshengfaniella alkalisoli]|uniref:DUF1993 domain-containing protein n=1 Tax=Qingshengfaniella alkalisoli TaxID=2599296 RepID=A0A5B8I839_9RHOB|nr:DUF1993 domain-containing protein [Qingshengfaniella alkalisoli]QDY69839.1 DUF1993 domain-containing protein [Qingshengfaniella alkalisoli]